MLTRALSDPNIDISPCSSGTSDFRSQARAFGAVDKFSTLGHQKHKKFEHLTIRKRKEWLARKRENGFIRLYSPSSAANALQKSPKSIVIPVTARLTVREICESFGLPSVYLEIGGQFVKQLPSGSRPLQVQNEILTTLGYETLDECMQLGDALHLRHVFALYMGRPESHSTVEECNKILVTNCLFRKGRLLNRWHRKRCIIYNGTIRVESPNGALGSAGDDEILTVTKFTAQVVEDNKTRCLRLASSSQQYFFVIEDPVEMQRWISHYQVAPSCDMSDQKLLFLPDRLFFVGNHRMITNLNLRRNSLTVKPTNVIGPLIGWIDDLCRFPSLRVLNLADNRIGSFPTALLRLTALAELNLSGNQIASLPSNVHMLANISWLNLSNNWLSSLPQRLADCSRLEHLDLSFNRFEKFPEAMVAMSRLKTWNFAGNYMTSLSVDAPHVINMERLDVRLNAFSRNLRFTSFPWHNLASVDLRHSGTIRELDLSTVPTIREIRCEGIGLRSIRAHGNALQEVYAAENELEQLIVMPIPSKLAVLDVSKNELEYLPEWLTDLAQLVVLKADHNRLKALPFRMFMNARSLRQLNVAHNHLTVLPGVVENCALEYLNISNNKIERLPSELFKTAHRLRHFNASNNCLLSLPEANEFAGLNRLHVLYLAGNQLTESVVPVLVSFRKLRLLDVSYNQMRFFNDSALASLSSLEELSLSGNLLTSLASELALMPNLRVLRAHSNRIASIPDLSISKTLKVLDLSNNCLERIKTERCLGPALRRLDLTCNPFCSAPQELRITTKARPLSVVDMGKKSSLPNIQFGYAQSCGQKRKICVRQIRPTDPNFVVFGMVDAGSSYETADLVKETLERFIGTQFRESSAELKRVILKTHEHLGPAGERLGASVLLLRVTDRKVFCSSSGHISALLCRRDGELIYLAKATPVTEKEEYARLRRANAIVTQDGLVDGVVPTGSSVGFYFLYPAITPSPTQLEVDMDDSNDFVVIGNRVLWATLSETEVMQAVREANNAQQAAKRLQDLAQSAEHSGNLSLIVIKFMRPSVSTRPTPTMKRRVAPPPPIYASIARRSTRSASSTGTSFRTRSRSEERVQDLTLRNIEERLEQISAAINKIEGSAPASEDGSSPRSRVVDAQENQFRNARRRTVRRLKESRRSRDSRSIQPVHRASLRSDSLESDVAFDTATVPSDPEITPRPPRPPARQFRSLPRPSRENSGAQERVRLLDERIQRFEEARLTLARNLRIRAKPS